ncbi:MAG: leucine-rich repeat protein [Eubacteriales bacterium]
MKKFLSFFVFIFVLSAVFCLVSFAATVNAEYTDESGMVWKVTANDEDMTAMITGVTLSERTKEFNVPSTVTVNDQEYTVTVIGQSAFSSNKVFGKLTLPDTLKEIKNGAFSGSYIYGEVVIPDSVTSIGSSAFSNCVGITEVTLPESIKTIPTSLFKGCSSLTTVKAKGDITSYDNEAFYCCYALTNMEISENTVSIGKSAFYSCYALKGHIYIPQVTYIGDEAFKNCSNITAVTIGSLTLNTNMFYGCTSIEEYNVSGSSAKYVSDDGVLLSTDRKTLCFYPAGKSVDLYVIPDTVTTISPFAFAFATAKKVYFNNVTKIETNAFFNSFLETVYIPDTVTSIGTGAFSQSPDIKWMVIGSGVTSIGIQELPSVQLIVARDDSFAGGSSLNNFVFASDYRCNSHFYGYLDDDPDCENGGHKECVVCQKRTELPALGHTGTILESSSLSCTTDEYKVIDCTRCNKVVKVVTAEHEGHIKQELPVTVETKADFRLYVCTKCLEVFYEDFSANAYKVGDINGDGKTDASDVSLLGSYLAGYSLNVNSFACDVNGDGKTDLADLLTLRKYVADPSGSSLDNSERSCKEHIRKVSLELYKPTCQASGLSIIYCLDCGNVLDKTYTDPAEHDFKVINEVKPTCSSDGFKRVECQVCGTQEKITLEKLPHTQNWVTLEERGVEYNQCEVCGEFESREVDYSTLDELIKCISPYYNSYYTPDTINLVKPILENYEQNLTQEKVDELVKTIESVLPKIKYNVSTVPAVYLETSKNYGKNNKDYTWAGITVVYTDEKGIMRKISDYDGQMRVRGNSTANGSIKYPFNIKFSKATNLFGFGEGKKYCLLANLYDKTLIRNSLAFEFAYALGLDYTPKYQFVDLYIDGTYNGSYILTTPVDVGEDRVDIDEETDFLLEVEDKSTSGLFYITSPIFRIKVLVESPEEFSSESYSKLYSTMYQIDFAILSGDWEEIQKYVDVDSMAKYYIFHEYVKTVDIVYDSDRFYIKDGKLCGGPAWDFDLSFGNVTNKPGGTANSYTGYWNLNGYGNGTSGDSTTGTWADATWLKKNGNDGDYKIWFYGLSKYSPEFMELVKQYILEYKDVFVGFYEDTLDEDGEIVELSTINKIVKDENIRASFDRNFNKFSISSKYTDMAYNVDINSYQDALDYLVYWCQARYEWMLEYYLPAEEEPVSEEITVSEQA